MNNYKVTIFLFFSLFYINFISADELNKNNIKTVTYCIDPHFMPYEQINAQGVHEGMSADFIKLIEKKTNLKFQLVVTKNYAESRELFEKGDCILVSSDVAPTSEVDFLYTDPYMFAENGIAVRENDNKDIMDFTVGTTGYIVGASTDQIEGSFKKDLNTTINLVPVENDLDGIRRVTSGEAKRFVSTVATMSYTLESNGIIGVNLVPLKDTMPFCMHIHKDYPQLLELLNKEIKNITAEERRVINQKWINVKLSSIDYKLLGKILLVVIVILILFTYYNRKMKQQKDFIQSILDSQKQIVVTIQEGVLKSCNKSFLNFFNISNLEGFSKEYGNKSIFDIFIFRNSTDIIKNLSTESFIELITNQNIKATIDNYIFSVSATKLLTHDDLYLIVFNDITEIENAKKEIEEIHEHTQQSIQYASITQHAILPEPELIDNFFNQYFMIWKPKDIVGGDIFLFEPFNNDNECLFMIIDCVGHGVAGALVTMLVKALEREIITEIISTNKKEISTSEILINFNRSMKQLLKQENKDSISNAGFDGAIIYYNKQKGILKYSGAQVPLYIIDNGELTVLKPDRQSIGYKKSDKDYIFKEHILTVNSGVQLFITTDGYIDQNGGEKDFPFGKKRFTDILEQNHHQFSNIKEILLEELESWRKNHHYNDDITVIGLKL